MFVFDNSEDLDIATYEYRLYTFDQVDPDPVNAGYFILNDNVSINSGTITPYRQGFNLANVFTVSVENSTTTSTTSTTSAVSYYGAIRAIDTSGNAGPWTLIEKTSTDTPLIDQQFIGSLTAAKITSGTIGAHEIILTQAGAPTSYTAPANVSVLRSSNYAAGSSGAGWLIRGDGFAEFDSTNIRGSISASSINLNTHNYWLPNSSNPIFKVGSSTKYFQWDGTDLTTTGNLITNATVTGGTVGGITVGSGATANRFYIGTGTFNNANTAFYVDNTGQFSLKDKLSWNGTTLTITGTIEVGGVEIGNDVGPGAGHYGISLSTSDFNNIFLRRSDGVYFFRVGNGGSNSLTWDSSSGVLNVTGAITATSGTFNGRLQAGDIYIPNTSSPVFSVTTAGAMTATSGTIANWTINASGLQNIAGIRTVKLYPAAGFATDPVLSVDYGGIKSEVCASGITLYNDASVDALFYTSQLYLRNGYVDAKFYYMSSTTTSDSADTIVRDSTTGRLYIKSSKRELKENISSISNSLTTIDKLSPQIFNWKMSEEEEQDEYKVLTKQTYKTMGFILEDVLEVSPELVTWRKNKEDGSLYPGYWKTDDFIALAIQGIKDLNKKVSDLELQILDLKRKK